MMARVAIVGAGVSGLSVGLCLAETHSTIRDLDLVIFAESFSGGGGALASDAAGAIIRPVEGASHYGGGDNIADTRRWTTVTYDRLRQLRGIGAGPECGLHKLPILVAHEDRQQTPLPWFASALHPEMKVLSPAESAEYNLSPRLETVWEYEIFRIEPSRYLDYLARSFRERGGITVRRKVKSLTELTRDYDVVVNCTGIGARELVGDESIFPVRGQMLQVQGPRMKAIYFNKKPGRAHTTYIIPSDEGVLLGGTADKDNWSTEVNPDHTHSIYRRCVEMCPQLAGSRVVREWAGLRPVRPIVRLEVDEESGSESLLVHNYGHGGHGYTYSWGCATEAAEMIQTHLQLEQTTSKL